VVTVSEANKVPSINGHPVESVVINDMMSVCSSHRGSLLIVSDQAASPSLDVDLDNVVTSRTTTLSIVNHSISVYSEIQHGKLARGFSLCNSQAKLIISPFLSQSYRIVPPSLAASDSAHVVSHKASHLTSILGE
jgi:hypothetical protein